MFVDKNCNKYASKGYKCYRQFNPVRKFVFILMAGLLWAQSARPQDPQFTQFYANQLYLSPSFAGATGHSRITAFYRNQWMSASVSPFSTYSIAFDHYFANFNSGVGLFVLRDLAGSGHLGTLDIGALYSYNFQIFPGWYVRPGLHFKYSQRSLVFENLTFIDQVLSDNNGTGGGGTTFAEPNQKGKDIDFASSLLLFNKRFWIGGTIDHLLKPNLSLYGDTAIIPIKYTVFGGYEIIRQSRLLNPIDETVSIAAMYRQQAQFRQLDLGLYWFKAPLAFGFWYRGIPIYSERGDALAFLIGYRTPHFHIGYSYDFTISRLIGSVWGAHEISLTYKFKIPAKKKRLTSVPCPEF